jgi:hypothetical protein
MWDYVRGRSGYGGFVELTSIYEQTELRLSHYRYPCELCVFVQFISVSGKVTCHSSLHKCAQLVIFIQSYGNHQFQNSKTHLAVNTLLNANLMGENFL